MSLVPAQIDEETHRKLKIVNQVTGVPIYILIKNICKVGFGQPGYFGIGQTFDKELKKALEE